MFAGWGSLLRNFECKKAVFPDSLYMMSHLASFIFSTTEHAFSSRIPYTQTVHWYTEHGICKLQLRWWFRTPALNEFLHISELLLCHATVILVTSFLKIGIVKDMRNMHFLNIAHTDRIYNIGISINFYILNTDTEYKYFS